MKLQQTDKNFIFNRVHKTHKNQIHKIFDAVEFIFKGWGKTECFVLFENKVFYLDVGYAPFKRNSKEFNMMWNPEVEEIEDLEDLENLLNRTGNIHIQENVENIRTAYNKINQIQV